MPSAVSTLNRRVFTVWCALPSFCELPETAVTGDTFAARFAGAPAASNTVTIPTTIPLTIPGMLMPNRGMPENSSPTKKRRAAHRHHVTAIPSATPAGIAVLHQFRASSLTKRIICCRLIPRQRIIPKNFVLWVILLFILLEIINTAAVNISTNNTPAVRKRVWVIVLVSRS